ncbi:MAG: integral membrane protein [Sulfurimonas sp.]|jgi:integral membrane protein
MQKNNVKKFRQINSIEGYSYLALLFIAMPIKYLFGYPIAVKIAGMAHGVLFIIFCVLLLKAWIDTKWTFTESIIFFVGSIIPFGTFYTKNKIKAYE